jgi:hypothetical protein
MGTLIHLSSAELNEIVTLAFTASGKTQNAVILSGAKNLSLFVLLYLNRREILRSDQHDGRSHFFCSLFSL